MKLCKLVKDKVQYLVLKALHSLMDQSVQVVQQTNTFLLMVQNVNHALQTQFSV